MATNLGTFQVRFSEKALGLPARELSKVVRKLAIDALGRLVARTPVDTGRARANWQVGISRPADGVIDAVDPRGGATVKSGVEAIAQLPPFPLVFITNNLPYIEALENGHSRQSPPGGMVRLTVEELRTVFS